MKKILIVSLLLLTTACASTSDINTLQLEIDTLRSNQVGIAKDLITLKVDVAAAKSSAERAEAACALINAKLDKVFAKAQYK